MHYSSEKISEKGGNGHRILTHNEVVLIFGYAELHQNPLITFQ